MPSDPGSVLRDIGRHIDFALRFVDGLTQDAFKDDLRTLYAVIRCLEVISEASLRLPSELKERHPGIPWSGMAAAGNVYRHEYEDVAPRLVWETVQLALPALQQVVDFELASQAGGKPGGFNA